MLSIALWVAAVGIVAWMSFRTASAHRKASQTYPRVEYDSNLAESSLPEKLLKPKTDLGLAVDHITQGTCVSIPYKAQTLDILLQLSGWFMICIGLYGMAQVVFGSELTELVLAIPLALIMGWTFLQMGRKVVRIEFRRDVVIFVVRFGGKLLRKFSYPWHPEIEFSGQYQSVLTMTSEQKEPDYKITITRPRIWFLQWSKSFLLYCNQSQGSWIVGALKSWADRKN